jgi:hypothetical protein
VVAPAAALATIPLRAGLVQRGLSGLTAGLGAWTVHQLTTERIVHSLDIPVREREPLAA